MAQRVLGIDLGAHTVKIAELDVGFRTVRLEELKTFGVMWKPGGAIERSLEALPEKVGVGGHDIVTVGMPGDRVLLRLFDIPFADPRKVAAVVGTELADDMPWEFEDVVYDHASSLRPGKVTVAAARTDQVRELLDALGARGVVPRHIGVTPLAYGGLVRRLYPDERVLLLDIGHLRTNACLLEEGRPLLARTISRAGAHITEALREAFQLGYPEAEQFKHTRALVVVDPGRLDAASQRIAQATELALAPLLREIKRTVQLSAGRTGVTPDRVVLCGGSSLLSGLDSYLAAELELPTERLGLATDAELAESSLGAEGQAVGALSLSLALEVGRREALDFRQGEFAFQTDRSIFREKLVALATAAVLLLVFAGINAYASMAGLRKQEKALEKELRSASRRVLGKVVLDPWKVSKTVKLGARKGGASIPVKTAVDVLDLVSRHVPPAGEIKLDIERIDIKAGKTYVRGTADSLSTVGNIVKALKKVSCFKEIGSGKISEVSGGRKQFSLTISSKCF